MLSAYITDLIIKNYTGVRVYQAYSYSQAKKVIYQCDIIITDVHLPLANGIDIVKEFQKRGKYFIICSGDTSRETVAAAYKAGITGYMSKPINNIILLEHLDPLIYNKRRLRHGKG